VNKEYNKKPPHKPKEEKHRKKSNQNPDKHQNPDKQKTQTNKKPRQTKQPDKNPKSRQTKNSDKQPTQTPKPRQTKNPDKQNNRNQDHKARMDLRSEPDTEPEPEPEDETKALFRVFQSKIEKLTAEMAVLGTLLSEMQKHPDAFDEEDEGLVMASLEHKEKIKASLQHEYSRRRHMYETRIQKLEENLKVRESLLVRVDSQCKVLESNPNLMKRFVQKQSQLQQMLEKLKQQLMTPMVLHNLDQDPDQDSEVEQEVEKELESQLDFEE